MEPGQTQPENPKISKFLILAILLFSMALMIQQCALSKKIQVEKEIPFSENFYPAPIKGEEIVAHSAIRISYNEKHEQANWVAYRLLNTHIGGSEKRKDRFLSDPFVSTFSAHPEDFKKTGFDRGHLAPAGDFSWSEKAMAESFYMSNISPQLPGFNRGIWNRLESQVRQWAVENEELYIVTAGVLSDSLPFIGNKNKVTIPIYYYKIILDLKEPEIKAIAFVMENKASKLPLKTFAVSIDSVERLTGIDFFHTIEDILEDYLESTLELEKWFKE
ncbi:MAG: DNA/RNA non-specific endonuclease [Bacteroidetes bacterium]|nr:DNA/RNA non-specific endonuclease [Bacteroidota bacterium]